MKVSLVVVCHHSSRVLPTCSETFRREAAAAGVEAEVVAVEHSEDAAELAKVEAIGVERLLVRPNRGYAAGLNAGSAEAGGDVLLLANPDIRFYPGSVSALLDGVARGFDVVGPQFVWDDEGTVFLPPAEDPSTMSELGRILRRRWRWAWWAGLQRFLEETWQMWTEESTLPVTSLRGALLAVPKETFGRFGPFDEGYFLYYEETEWLWRARRRGASLGFAAGARIRHRWGHSTDRLKNIVEHEQRSRERFFARNYGAQWRSVLDACERDSQRPPYTTTRVFDVNVIPEREADIWLASPSIHLMPALGCLWQERFPPPLVEFCRDRRWPVLAANRTAGKWRCIDVWTWGH